MKRVMLSLFLCLTLLVAMTGTTSAGDKNAPVLSRTRKEMAQWVCLATAWRQ